MKKLHKVISFKTHRIECKAFVMFGNMSINFDSCVINISNTDTISVGDFDDFYRVSFSDRSNSTYLWFDTSEQSAMDLKEMFEMVTNASDKDFAKYLNS